MLNESGGSDSGYAAQIDQLQRRLSEVKRHRDWLAKEVDRLRGWLVKIEGGDNPCENADLLRDWAYRAITLCREVE